MSPVWIQPKVMLALLCSLHIARSNFVPHLGLLTCSTYLKRRGQIDANPLKRTRVVCPFESRDFSIIWICHMYACICHVIFASTIYSSSSSLRSFGTFAPFSTLYFFVGLRKKTSSLKVASENFLP